MFINIQDISVSIVPGFGLNDPRSILAEADMSIYLFPTTSIKYLGLTQRPVQGVSGALPLKVKRTKSKADHLQC
jgi:hypothetical protein